MGDHSSHRWEGATAGDGEHHLERGVQDGEGEGARARNTTSDGNLSGEPQTKRCRQTVERNIPE